jgi:hypothetical protein
MHFDAIEVDPLRYRAPRATQQIYAMAPRHDPPEDFPEMKLRAARLRILEVLPVQYEYPH